MISVIITTHKGRLDFLKRAVQSVFDQTHTEWELIIVLDGPDKLQKEYIQTLKGNVRAVFRKSNFGNDTRPKNDGIKESTGKYIAFLDCDNTYRPNHLRLLYQIMESADVDVVYGDRMIHDTEKRFESRVGVYSEYNPNLIYGRNYIDTSDVLIKRKALYDVGGWDERYSKYVDWNLFLRLTKAGKTFKRYPMIITDYYVHDKQKSALVHTKEDDEKKGVFKPDWDPIGLEIRLPYLGPIKDTKVAIFTLTKDRLEYTKDCFKSLHDKAGYPFDHFVIDNGSTDGTVEWLRQEEQEGRIKNVIYLTKNQGIARGSNKAIDEIMSYAEYDIIIKYDNDCLSKTDNWVKEIVELHNTDHRMCFSPYPEGLRDSPGGPPRVYGYIDIKGHMLGGVRHIGGFCHVGNDLLYRKFRWNEDSTLHGLQDLELSQYCENNNIPMCYVEDLFVEHYKGTTQQHLDYPEYFELRKIELTQKKI